MKKWICLILLTLPLLLAANLSLTVDIPRWNLTRSGTDANLPLLMKAGNPALPFYPVKVLLPMGHKVVQVATGFNRDNLNVSNNVSLDMVLTPQPISKSTADRTIRNTAVWNTDTFYPAMDYRLYETQMYKGYGIAVINLYPWHYNPMTKVMTYTSAMTLDIQTEYDENLAFKQSQMLVCESSTRSSLSSVVLNPEQTASYRKYTSHTPSSRTINLTTPRKMVIITSTDRMSWFTEYAAWKGAANISTGIFSIEDILSDYMGEDEPDKLRNFILDAYQTWSATPTPLEYVILAGDDEIIPIRGVYGAVGETIDNWMPCDLYYGCLDGSWNYDGDELFGEYPSDQVDLLPEVYIGRFPAETQAEFQHIIDKTQYYVNNNTYSNNIAQFYGENLNWDPVTWGGDYKDAVATFLPDDYHLSTYYQRDGTYSPQIVWDTINSGAAVMNHMGHANEVFLMGQGNGSIETLTNTEYGFLYSQGCYPAAFDQRTSGAGESIGEHLLTASGGLYAFIGNTRYGWYMPGSIDGPSEYFDRQFFAGMYDNNLPQLGKAMEYSLLQNVNSAMDDDVMLWCYYETILFGDPSTSVKLPNASLPCLALEDYRHDDIDGDGDGSLNPGELVRLYPRVQNLPGWNTAYTVWVNTDGLPEGVSAIVCHMNIGQLESGAYVDSTMYISFQLPEDMPFGHYDYTIRLRSYDQATGAVLCDRSYKAGFDVTILDNNFPWDCFYSGKSSPAVGDFDSNGQNEILYSDVYGNGYFIGHDGVQTGSFSSQEAENINRSFAVSRSETQTNPVYSFAFTSRTGKIYSVTRNSQGTDVFNVNYDTGSICLFTPVYADIDNNGLQEIIATAHNKKIYALSAAGLLLPGFPVELTAPFNCELAVADLDNNGTMEIIAGTTDGKLWIINADGSIKTGFPVNLNGAVSGSPLVLDNHNIVVGTNNRMYIVSPTGSIVVEKTIAGDMAGGAIPADICRDNITDLVFVTASGKVYACNQDGSDIAGFPVDLNLYFTCPPLAADIDGDDQFEIILQSYMNSIFILNNNGIELPGFPFPNIYNGATPATLTDLDGDGTYDLVCGYSNGILVVKLRRSMGDLDSWTTYRGGLNRQGSVVATGFVSNEDQVAVAELRLESNFPNPFNPETTLRFNLPKADNQTTLIIYNSKGQKVKTMLDGKADKGTHSLVWNGRDDTGKAVSSGVYFYRLQTAGKTLSRKMLLMK